MLKDSHASADMILTGGFPFSLLPLSSQTVRGNKMQRIRCTAHLDVSLVFKCICSKYISEARILLFFASVKCMGVSQFCLSSLNLIIIVGRNIRVLLF